MKRSRIADSLQLHLRFLFGLAILSLLAGLSNANSTTQGAATTTREYLTLAEKNWIKANPIATVGGSPDWTPFNFQNKKGEYSGIANDYLQLIAKKTGLKFEVSIAPWSTNLKKLQDNKIDLLGAVYYTEERNRDFHLSTPYFEVLDFFFIRDDINAKTLEDLKGMRVAIPKDYAHIQFLQKHFPEIHIVEVDTFSEAIDTVLEKRAELLYDTYGSLIYTIEKKGINTISPFKSTSYLGNKNIHIATRKQRPELASIIQKGLNAISESEQRAIYKKWLGSGKARGLRTLKLTAEEERWVSQQTIVHYGAERDWPPYDFMNEQGQHDGISHDYLTEIANITGLEFRPIFDNWPTLLAKLETHQLDLLPAIYFSKERNKAFNLTLPYQEMIDYLFIRDDSKAETIEDLNGKTIAIPEGFLYVDTVKNSYPNIDIIEVNDVMEAIESVIEGKADILVDAHPVVSYLLKKHSITTLRPFKPLLPAASRKLHMATSQDKTILATILDKALTAIPEIKKQELHGKWFGLSTNREPERLILSEREQAWLRDHPTIRFAGDPDWLPYEAFDQQGNYIGIAAEHLKIIEQRLGIKLQIVQTTTWRESVEKVNANQIDVLSVATSSPLGSRLEITQDYISSPLVIVMRNNQDYVDEINQVADKKIAVIKSYGYTAPVMKKYPAINFKNVETVNEGLTAVSTGKIDVFLATLAQASYHIAELGINNVRIVGKTEFNTKLAFGMQKELAPLADLFNRALSSISPREKQEILSHWGKPVFKQKTNYWLFVKIITAFTLVILFIIYWNRKLAKEVRLRKNAEQQIQTLIDNVPLQIIVTSMDGSILNANPQASSDHNIPLEDINHYNISDFYSNHTDRESILKEIAETGKVEQKIIPIKETNGEIKSLMLSIQPIIYQDQPALLSIAVDMTKRFEIEKALNEAKEHAEKASLAKSQFLANMSHEIRTPMNAILGFTHLLYEQVHEPKLKSYINTIQSSGNNLLVLINDILDISKIEAGKFELDKHPCNLTELFHSLADIFKLKIAEKNIQLDVEIDPNIPDNLYLDAARVRQVLLNLLGNAVKFTNQGQIRLQVFSNGQDKAQKKVNLTINIQDTGIGISEDQQQCIFEEFTQSHQQDGNSYGGTGLGLSISKRLIEMMNGALSLSSVLGQGSTFTINLQDIDIVPDASSEGLKNEAHTGNSSIVFLPAKVLVVDDVQDNRELIIQNFTSTPLQFVTAQNGLEAVNLAKSQPFDLVLMDIRMPVMDGYDAARQIKSFSCTPIIALTASVMTDEFNQVKSCDFDGYLRKPATKKELTDELCKFLSFKAHAETPELELRHEIHLSDTEHAALPFALERLNTLAEHHQDALNNNNISDTLQFAKSLLTICEQYPLAPISSYAKQLIMEIDAFDISAIKRSLNSYPKLIEALKNLL
jgi:two-component system sensor histidine kinase EvgS